MNANKACLPILFFAGLLQGAGSIAGTVVDPSGAVVPNSSITVRAAGVELHDRSNEAGAFVFSDLKPGEYSIEVQMPGFRKFTKESIPVGLEPVDLGAVPLSIGFIASCVTDPPPKTRAVRGSTGVEGRISTRYGVSPSEVTIAIGNRGIDQWITTHADSSGRFAFERLPPGTYYLTADLPTAPRPGRVFRSYYGIVVPSGKRIRIVEPLTLPPCTKTGPCGILCL
jgi:hypothetical protein